MERRPGGHCLRRGDGREEVADEVRGKKLWIWGLLLGGLVVSPPSGCAARLGREDSSRIVNAAYQAIVRVRRVQGLRRQGGTWKSQATLEVEKEVSLLGSRVSRGATFSPVFGAEKVR
jgi:hypothetical protein